MDTQNKVPANRDQLVILQPLHKPVCSPLAAERANRAMISKTGRVTSLVRTCLDCAAVMVIGAYSSSFQESKGGCKSGLGFQSRRS
jgi:hypothetical protein